MRKWIILITLVSLTLVSFNKIEKRIISEHFHQKIILNDTLNWKKLGYIKFVKKQHKDYGMIDYPVISPEIKMRNNKRVIISGFIVPIDNVNYAISKNVFASCFFCGKAGPETIAGLKFKEGKKKLRTDQYVTISGTLKLNETDVDNWMYNLIDVVILKGE
ncbi:MULTISPECIES: hypothetical protein [Flavobacterium]|uniref:DUF3299 domain-containing protein n=2 Tax=Flavobacterium TaxID=237 RepID=A0AA94F0F5_9FLAO|nr:MULTISPECIES: hypothetical protein [Flavobacterium]OXA82349.1 hypothetical protein B0A56_04955 [Flavobacterium columnare NBRC 100251 = ATCC 23463]AMA49923.1 hypothetical protein AWN65_10885 [Flavobacterium covae]AND64545.1 hypothetical protein AX766_09015 [Flavobacterium covae]MCH4829122.1 hypothetical protein [Flavobacterium columnare]MCH4833898.1 hypothetical protein [Flavobacterium columnare]